MNEKVKLENIKTKIEVTDDYTYLYLIGEFKNKTTGEKQIIKVPKICLNELLTIRREKLGLFDNSEKLKVTYNYPSCYFINKTDMLHSVEFALHADNDGCFVKFENEVKEMTKEEIEKELGYKIRIV